MRVLVSGARGFIGTHVVERLTGLGHTVIELDVKPFNGSQCVKIGQSAIRLRGSVLDPGTVRMAYAQKPTHVVHLASIAGVPNVTERPVATMDVITLGTLNMAKNAPEGLESFVFLSTSEVQGIHAFQVAENRSNTVGPPGEARWTYAVAKLHAEHYLMAAHKQDKLPVAVLRPFNVYGPRQVGFGAVHEFVKAGLVGDTLNVFHNGTQIRSWCYVSDMVDAIMLALENPRSHGEIFNIGNPSSTVSVYQLAKMIREETGAKSAIYKHPRVFQDVELRSPNIEKAIEVLGFSPKVELEEGLRRTIEWYREDMYAQEDGKKATS